jgi:hypothetical protein
MAAAISRAMGQMAMMAPFMVPTSLPEPAATRPALAGYR